MEDLISRKTAKKVLCEMCEWAGTSKCEECEHPIDDIPSVWLGRKTGHWISVDDIIWLCSECKFADGRKRNYCPNCGAKMDGTE